MRAAGLQPSMGGGGKTVEVDETYIGRLKGQPGSASRRGTHKNTVLTLVERGGSARSFHIDSATRRDYLADRSREHRARNRS